MLGVIFSGASSGTDRFFAAAFPFARLVFCLFLARNRTLRLGPCVLRPDDEVFLLFLFLALVHVSSLLNAEGTASLISSMNDLHLRLRLLSPN
jgi:hypothetical protein